MPASVGESMDVEEGANRMARRHTVSVPDWMWQQAQEETGQERPASHIVDAAAETFIARRVSAEAAAAGQAVQTEHKGRTRVEPHYVGDWRPVYINTPTNCNKCRGAIERGEWAFIGHYVHGSGHRVKHIFCRKEVTINDGLSAQ